MTYGWRRFLCARGTGHGTPADGDHRRRGSRPRRQRAHPNSSGLEGVGLEGLARRRDGSACARRPRTAVAGTAAAAAGLGTDGFGLL